MLTPLISTATDERARVPGATSRTVGQDYRAFGVVLPVLAGSAGAGASVLAAALTDALRAAGRCPLLVDTADPARSGLISASETDGQWTTGGSGGVWARYSWRDGVGGSLIARVETDQPHALIPWLPPPAWALDPAPSVEVTVADLGQGWLWPADDPLSGPGSWLRPGIPAAPRPLLVVRATRPSLIAAEAALAQLDPWVRAGAAVPPAQLVVMAAWKRAGWPPGVVGAAGARVAALLEDAVVVPYEQHTELGGVTEQPTSRRLQAAVAPLLRRWGLLGPPHPRP
ncbi:MAG: hypothetical protein ACT4O0_05315 [Pseudonocardia sp.]